MSDIITYLALGRLITLAKMGSIEAEQIVISMAADIEIRVADSIKTLKPLWEKLARNNQYDNAALVQRRIQLLESIQGQLFDVLNKDDDTVTENMMSTIGIVASYTDPSYAS